MSTHEAERAAKEAIDRHFHDAYVRGHADGRAEVLKKIAVMDVEDYEDGVFRVCRLCRRELREGHESGCLWLEAQQATKAPTTGC